MEKTYTLGELLESPKGQEMLDENLDAHVDVDVVEAILELDYWKYDAEQKETFYTLDDLENAINDVDKKTYFMSMDDYYDYCDETVEFPKGYDYLERYFEYDAFHTDCEYDATEASNWVVFLNY